MKRTQSKAVKPKRKGAVKKADRLFYEKLLAVIPRNWLHPLLTGPDAVLGKPPWGCPDVERLLQKIEAQQYALMSEHIRRQPPHPRAARANKGRKV